jgi:nucleoside-diphosphate-sugar epimerase
MKVFVAGASGAIGAPLVRQLVAAGHEVVATTRTPGKAELLQSAGARPAVVDAMDPDALKAAVFDAQPDAVIDELTNLPQKISPFGMKHFYDKQTPLKATAAPALIEASKAVGARVHIMQSIAFIYAPGGAPIKDESAATYSDAPAPWDTALKPFEYAENAITTATEFAGIVLRYGYFYGPNTHYAADGAVGAMVRKRQFPILGKGTGISSFIHIEDAASATVAALESGEHSGVRGVFNVVDDDPAPMHEWLPEYAEAMGAKPPRHVPLWLGRLTAGPLLAHFATTLSGASNARIKSAMGWKPTYASWRDGFRTELAS